MRKNVRPIALHRETLRCLIENDLARIQGAASNTNCNNTGVLCCSIRVPCPTTPPPTE